MLQIILLIFKIIGLILLSLLGLLLFLLLLVLFVPIRYRVTASHGKEYFQLESRISWLLHILHARISIKDSNPWIRLRLFGFIVYDNLRVKKERSKSRPVTSKKRKKNSSRSRQNQSSNTTKETGLKIKQADETKTKTGTGKAEDIQTSDTIFHTKEHRRMVQESEQKKSLPEPEERFEEDTEREHQASQFERLKNFLRIIKLKITGFFQSLINKIKKLFQAVANISQKISLIKAFIKDELNQEVFRLTFSSIKKLLKHILPRKLKSSIIFGTGDPCSTGQALGVLAILYSFYGDKIQITPDFENKRLEGKHYARGRIRLVTILIIVIKLIIDRRFKQFIGNMKTLKEAL